MSDFLRLKCTKIVFGWGSAPDPAGGAYSAPPDPRSWIKGGPILLREGEGVWEGRKGRKDRGGEKGGTGREGTPNILLHPSSSFLEICLRC